MVKHLFSTMFHINQSYPDYAQEAAFFNNKPISKATSRQYITWNNELEQ